MFADIVVGGVVGGIVGGLVVREVGVGVEGICDFGR